MLIKTLKPTNFLCVDMMVIGDLILQGQAYISSQISGKVSSESKAPLFIETDAWIKGSVISEGTIHIRGQVEGDVLSKEKIVIYENARVQGHISSPDVVVHSGCQLNADIYWNQNQQLKVAA